MDSLEPEPEVDMEAEGERAGGNVSTALSDLEMPSPKMPSMEPSVFGGGSPDGGVTPMLGQDAGFLAFTEGEAAMAEAVGAREGKTPAKSPTNTFSSEEEVGRDGSPVTAGDMMKVSVTTETMSALTDEGGAEEVGPSPTTGGRAAAVRALVDDAGSSVQAASPTIDTVTVNKKLSDLKPMKKTLGQRASGARDAQQSRDWNGGISIAEVPDDLKLLESNDLNRTLTETLADETTEKIGLKGSPDPNTDPNKYGLDAEAVKGRTHHLQTRIHLEGEDAIDEMDFARRNQARKERKDQKSMEGMKLKMRRMTSFNRGSALNAKKADKEGGGKAGKGGKEDKEKEKMGPHVAPRIAHSLLHGKPAHVPAMYAAEGMDLISRSSLEHAAQRGLKEEKDKDLFKDELLRMCEVVLDEPPLSRTVKQLRQLGVIVKANGFTIGGEVPDFISMECWRYVMLERIPASFTMMKQGDDSDFMCFILDGLVDVFVNEVQQNTVGFGAAVGELALMQDPVGKRSATLIARGPCLIARLDFIHYHRILKTEHESAADNRNKQLAQFPIFRDWPTASLLRVSRFLEYKKYKRGDAVILSELFIIASGLVGVVVHIAPESEVEHKVADQWLKKTRANAKLDDKRSAPTQKSGRKVARKTTVEVARLGPGHHFSNVKRQSDDPRKLNVRWDRKTRAKSKLADVGRLGELAAAMQPEDTAPFTVVCHTDCVLYRMDMSKLYEFQAHDVSMLRTFYETSPEIPEGSYIRDLIHQQMHWNEYKGDLIDGIVDQHKANRLGSHGSMIAGEALVSRRSRGDKFSSTNLSSEDAMRSRSALADLYATPDPIGAVRGPARNISQPPTKTSMLREFHASQRRLGSVSLPVLNPAAGGAMVNGQGHLPFEAPMGADTSVHDDEHGFDRMHKKDRAGVDRGARFEDNLGRSGASYRRWMKVKEQAGKAGASLRVPTPELKSGNGVARTRMMHHKGTDSGLGHTQLAAGAVAGAVSATDHLTALVLNHKDQVVAAKKGAGIYGDTLWEKHDDLLPTDNMEALERLRGWGAMRKAAQLVVDEAPRFLKPDTTTAELLDLFAGHQPPRYKAGDEPPPSEASLQADPWLQHDLAMIPGIQAGERKGTSIDFSQNRDAGLSGKLPKVRAVGAGKSFSKEMQRTGLVRS